MKKSLSLFLTICSLLLLSAKFSIAQTDEEWTPKTPFDTALARKMLDPGTATITGVAYRRANTLKKNKVEYIIVTLYPVTPYFVELQQLRKKAKSWSDLIKMSAVAHKYRIETKTDAKGNFTFSEMKPGKYYLEASMPYSLSGQYTEKIGSVSDNAGNTVTVSGPTQTYNVNLSHEAEKYVEITKEGETVTIKLN
jgi:hypothetical protein